MNNDQKPLMQAASESQPAAVKPRPSKPVSVPPSPTTLMALYDPTLALEFFRSGGQEESFAAGERIFAELDNPGGFFSKGSSVYLLLEGEVALTVKDLPLAVVSRGETFGELAIISDAPRSATAVARTPCRVLSLDKKRFLNALSKLPEFAQMMISIMALRLLHGFTELLDTTRAPISPHTDLRGLSKSELSELRLVLGDPPPTRMNTGDQIITKGSLGTKMFVLLSGQVSIHIDGRVVEHLKQGGIFGEMAMLGQVGRSATVVADTEGYWITLSPVDFLHVVKSKPAIGLGLLRTMSERIRATTDLLREIGGKA